MENQEQPLSQAELSEILKVRRDKLQELKESGSDPFCITRFDRTHASRDVSLNFEELSDQEVSIAGRLMSRRIMGKASFAHLLDGSGQLQFYVRREELGDEEYKAFKALDIGDIVGVVGKVFKTKTGEVSVHASNVTLLAKSLQPLPEKFHGLKDPDLRYRNRHVDLIVNPQVRDTFVARTKVIRGIREFLDARGYLEVDTPVLQTTPGGANARPFITHHNTLDLDMYLRIATELFLKRLIIGGFEKVYEMGRIFRNEGMSVKHNPEFTTIELYEAYADYHDMMNLCEEMVSSVAVSVLGSDKVSYQEQEISFERPWKRITMNEAVKNRTGADFMAAADDAGARELAKGLHIEVKPTSTRGDLLNAAFEEFVEETLVQPTFIIDYPIEVSPLAKRKPDCPELTERFELFITGREMANAFSELNDPIDQYERFADQVRARDAGDDEAQMMDEDFVLALETGMPPTGGMGIGIDRLVMLLTDAPSIRDVLLFPTMKPKDNQ